MDTIHKGESRIINGVDLEKLQKTIDTINGNPDLALIRFSAHNDWTEGAFSRTTFSRVDGSEGTEIKRTPFFFESDELEFLSGKEQAPNPIMATMHALASCLCTTFIYNAASKGIKIDNLQFDLEGEIDLHGFLGLSSEVRAGFQDLRVLVTVDSQTPRQELEDLLNYSAKVSPVVDSLRNRIPLEITLK